MARLTKEQLLEELNKKQLTLVSDYTEYKNVFSEITVRCSNGHKFTTDLKTVRLANFTCPICVGNATKGFKNDTKKIPPKKGHRVIGIDNATKKMGISVFDDGRLVYYGLLSFNEGSYPHRLNSIRKMFEDTIIPE
ncbi:MAG: hypothetical protein ACOCQD_01305 [archaeon]